MTRWPCHPSARSGCLTKIALIKCDIEGSEFELFKRGSRLLAMADQVAIEIHAATNDPKRSDFVNLIRDEGFEVIVRQENPNDCIINGKRQARPARPMTTSSAESAPMSAAAPA